MNVLTPHALLQHATRFEFLSPKGGADYFVIRSHKDASAGDPDRWIVRKWATDGRRWLDVTDEDGHRNFSRDEACALAWRLSQEGA